MALMNAHSIADATSKLQGIGYTKNEVQDIKGVLRFHKITEGGAEVQVIMTKRGRKIYLELAEEAKDA